MSTLVKTHLIPGDLDRTFAKDGVINIGPGSCGSVVETKTGRIVYVHDSADGLQLIRAYGDGSTDPSFANQPWQYGPEYSASRQLAIQDDDGIVAIGSTGAGMKRLAAVTKFNAHGSQNLVFGTKIFPAIPLAPGQSVITHEAQGCALSDGRVLLGQSHILHDETGAAVKGSGIIRCYLTNGDLDNTFGVNGEAKIIFDNARSSRIESIKPKLEGGFIVSGSLDNSTGNQSEPKSVLAGYDESGKLDKGFATGGLYKISEEYSLFNNLDVSPRGITFAASVLSAEGIRVATVRLQNDGTPDPDFNNGQVLWTDINGRVVTIQSVVVQPDASIIVGVRSDHVLTLLRILEDGKPDDNFGDGGVARLEGWRMNDCIVQSNTGRIIAAADEIDPAGKPLAQVLGFVG
ncbi:hypothetical protein QLG12_13710 [Pseudomonas sp. V88_4]|uniref:hypothetical protein n=1 Tax=Pseudomonas sp. V88_4 TaxID=3044229 RepID=UPI00249E8DBF|nr:hypothetical protein [Pseudomonas sp. V88_4]MDI3399262.1 hypothetical protein [Pseudomonas sp. V88_4]